MINLGSIPPDAAATADRSSPLKRPPWIGFVVSFALAACGQSSNGGKASPAVTVSAVERAGPIAWNAASGGFELNGRPLKTIKLWTFDGSTDGFTSVRSKVIPGAGSGIAVTIVDPTLRSPKGLNVPGGQFPLVVLRMTRTAPGGGWDGALYYSTANHAESISYLGKPVSGANPAVGETTTLVYDMSRQAIGAPDWIQSTIDQIRFDLEDRPGGGFLIRQVAIAENPDPSLLTGGAPTAASPTSAAAAAAPPPAKPKS